MDSEAWQATVHGVTKSQTWPRDWAHSTHAILQFSSPLAHASDWGRRNSSLWGRGSHPAPCWGVQSFWLWPELSALTRTGISSLHKNHSTQVNAGWGYPGSSWNYTWLHGPAASQGWVHSLLPPRQEVEANLFEAACTQSPPFQAGLCPACHLLHTPYCSVLLRGAPPDTVKMEDWSFSFMGPLISKKTLLAGPLRCLPTAVPWSCHWRVSGSPMLYPSLVDWCFCRKEMDAIPYQIAEPPATG